MEVLALVRVRYSTQALDLYHISKDCIKLKAINNAHKRGKNIGYDEVGQALKVFCHGRCYYLEFCPCWECEMAREKGLWRLSGLGDHR